MKKDNLLNVLGKSHAIDILESLSKRSMRFTDLEEICKSKRTRAARLKELEKEGLIISVPKIIGRRACIFYEITPKGRKALTLGKKLRNL